MAYPDLTTIGTLELNLPSTGQIALLERERLETASTWFAKKFPDSAHSHGVPFVEMKETSCDGFNRVTPVHINIDFFASILGGDPKLGHSVVYFEPEMQFYYREPVSGIYKATTPEKLQTYFRAMLMRCAQELPAENNKLNLCVGFRELAKQVVQKAKSIVAVDHTYFSAQSPHQRVKGPELYERLMRVLVETMLEKSEGACLTVTQAYQAFCRLSQQRSLGQLKRSTFKEIMRELISETHGLALRHDVPDSENRHQQAWKGLKLIGANILGS